ncbi:hypothetical protein E2320_005384 [Naja naja]|nr:hypothetical protein E2320_005384 [Naja naja]
MAGEGITETAAKESLHWTHGKHLRERKYSSPCRFLQKPLERQTLYHTMFALIHLALCLDKIEQQITLDQLQKLYTAFQGLETSGHKSVDAESFKHILKTCVGSHNAVSK